MTSNRWIVFWHHLAAIAGAGPLIDPTLAEQYGWDPGLFWILLGSFFARAVHDMVILVGSVRQNGHSLSVIARRDVGRVTGAATAFVALVIILIALTGFAAAVAKALF